MEKQQPEAGADPVPAAGEAQRPQWQTFYQDGVLVKSITLPTREAGDPVTGLFDRFAEEYPESLRAIQAVATSRDILFFGDLAWNPFDADSAWAREIEGRDLGVIFESPTRVVVIEEHVGELRYYAGGWRSRENRIHLEWDRIEAEGSELGVLPTFHAAVCFTERFLVRDEALQDIDIPRQVLGGMETDKSSLPALRAGAEPVE